MQLSVIPSDNCRWDESDGTVMADYAGVYCVTQNQHLSVAHVTLHTKKVKRDDQKNKSIALVFNLTV